MSDYMIQKADDQIEDGSRERERLIKENELLRECVEFYADDKGHNWAACRDEDTYKSCCHMISEISGGEKARECLAKLGER